MSTQDERYCFIAEWYDPAACVVRTFNLLYFPGDNTVEMFDLKTRRTFLKRSKVENIRTENIYVGASINILSRQLTITDMADEYTRKKFSTKNERTLGMIKPDALNHIGEILDLIQQDDFHLCNLKMIKLSKSDASQFYIEHQAKSFFEGLTAFISSGKIVVMELMGSNAIQRWRQLMGPTDSNEARSTAARSIRARFGTDGQRNACHGSDSSESASRELEFFFPSSGKDAYPNVACFTDATCCLIKPHAVVEGQSGPIINKIEGAGFEISAMQMFYLDKANSEEFLEVYKGVVNDYAAMVAELCSGPCLVLEVRAQNAQQTFREFTGPSDPEIARHLRPRTLRAQFGKDKIKNAVHCTDLEEDAILELEYFFKILSKC